ncbi:hypothetical protein GCM10009413_32600 [Tatumella punctata]
MIKMIKLTPLYMDCDVILVNQFNIDYITPGHDEGGNASRIQFSGGDFNSIVVKESMEELIALMGI